MSENAAHKKRDPLWPYVGDWQALQSGNTHHVLQNELVEQKKLRPGRNVPLEDPLARYKAIPLHAYFLDPFAEVNILEYYGILDGMSRDRCDIYLSLEQLRNPEEAFDFLEGSDILKRSEVHIMYSDLPGLFFWDQQEAGEYISFGSHPDRQKVGDILKQIFDQIRREPTIAAVKRAKQALSRM
jgi:hypothetical protein